MPYLTQCIKPVFYRLPVQHSGTESIPLHSRCCFGINQYDALHQFLLGPFFERAPNLTISLINNEMEDYGYQETEFC